MIKRIAQLVNGREILSSFGEIILRLKNFNINRFFKIKLYVSSSALISQLYNFLLFNQASLVSFNK